VVNFFGAWAQAKVRLPWEDMAGSLWRMTDALSGEIHERSGDEMTEHGLFVDLPPWGFHVLTGWEPVCR
jgi:hypothetical protein